MKAYILTPLGPVFEGDVTSVKMPGAEGGFEVRSGHAKLISLLDTGKLVVQTQEDVKNVYALSGGFTEISDDVVTVLAEEAIETSRIDLDTEYELQDALMADLKEAKEITTKTSIERELKKVRNRIQTVLSANKDSVA